MARSRQAHGRREGGEGRARGAHTRAGGKPQSEGAAAAVSARAACRPPSRAEQPPPPSPPQPSAHMRLRVMSEEFFSRHLASADAPSAPTLLPLAGEEARTESGGRGRREEMARRGQAHERTEGREGRRAHTRAGEKPSEAAAAAVSEQPPPPRPPQLVPAVQRGGATRAATLAPTPSARHTHLCAPAPSPLLRPSHT